MSYRFDLERPLSTEIARVAREEIQKAADELADRDSDRGEAIHDARKRLKKLRGLVRLVRDGDEDFYRSQNTLFRDIARELSGARDRTALIEALDGLRERYQEDSAAAGFPDARKELERRRDAVLKGEGDIEARIDDIVRRLRDADAHWADWGPKEGDARKSLLSGVAANHRRARRELREAERAKSSEAFHALRKRVKYHSMHLKLLGEAWPEAIKPMRSAASQAADDLGRDHDYAVLREEMERQPEGYGRAKERKLVDRLAAEHQEELRAGAAASAHRLFAEKPKAFRRRIEAYLKTKGRE